MSLSPQTDVSADKMLRDARVAASVGRTAAFKGGRERPLWVAPALQAFSGNFCGHFRQYRRLSGLFMFWHCLHWP